MRGLDSFSSAFHSKKTNSSSTQLQSLPLHLLLTPLSYPLLSSLLSFTLPYIHTPSHYSQPTP